MHAQLLLNGVIGNTQLPFTNYRCVWGGVVCMCLCGIQQYIHTYLYTYIQAAICDSALRKEPVLHVLITKYE